MCLRHSRRRDLAGSRWASPLAAAEQMSTAPGSPSAWEPARLLARLGQVIANPLEMDGLLTSNC